MAISRLRKRLLVAIGVVVVAVFALAISFIVSARRTAAELASVMPDVAIAIKGAMGQAMFGAGRVAPSKVGPKEGLIAAYQHDPATFRHYADLYDTASTGLRIGRIVSGNRTAYKLPMLSSELTIDRGETKDAWGHPYCITALKEQILVVSGGAQVNSFSCAQRKVSVGQLASTTRTIFETDAGEVIILVRENRSAGDSLR
jgi:HAMP domain-containing protein